MLSFQISYLKIVCLLLLKHLIFEDIDNGVDHCNVLSSLVDHVAVSQLCWIGGVESRLLHQGCQVAIDGARLA